VNTWIIAGVVGAAMVSGAAGAAAQSPLPDGPGLTIVVDLVDDVRVPPEVLAEAEARATASYRAVGIAVVWVPSQSDASGIPAPPVSHAIHVRVVIVPHAKAEAKCAAQRLGANVTGTAISGAPDARSRIAYVFYNRIERLALTQGTPVPRGLGHVMAHEIGHLLLGANSHSPKGLMRPDWQPRETHVQTLTRDQVVTVWRRSGESWDPPL
jgi:hypothetical protein